MWHTPVVLSVGIGFGQKFVRTLEMYNWPRCASTQPVISNAMAALVPRMTWDKSRPTSSLGKQNIVYPSWRLFLLLIKVLDELNSPGSRYIDVAWDSGSLML